MSQISHLKIYCRQIQYLSSVPPVVPCTNTIPYHIAQHTAFPDPHVQRPYVIAKHVIPEIYAHLGVGERHHGRIESGDVAFDAGRRRLDEHVESLGCLMEELKSGKCFSFIVCKMNK